ncbi:ATP-binding protein [Woodsholea maritima]|uniref:ATP-binding protein n=1 Tax=Woodsholea maritima TaxID=240237 RepID=UPI0003827121|nr:ATP-binding protein [Woodsholea maritima]
MTNGSLTDDWTGQVIWIALDDQIRSQAICEALDDPDEYRLYCQMDPPVERVGIALFNDESVARLNADQAHMADAFQTILLTENTSSRRGADFLLRPDSDVGSILSVIRAAGEFREQVLSLKKDVQRRKSAIGSIISGEFSIRTLEEARNLSTMLSLACPQQELVAVGLQELLINAIEHGNLEIDAETKDRLLKEGQWREEVERRLKDPHYSHRQAHVRFRRGERLITIVIEDEGSGFDYSLYENKTSDTNAYRGRGILMAKELAFDKVIHLGDGSIVEAVIEMSGEGEEASF